MKAFKIKYTIILLAWVLALTGISAYTTWTHFNEYYSHWIFIVPVFFLIMEGLQLHLLAKAKSKSIESMQNTYMMFRLAKMFCTMFLVVIYWLTIKHGFKTFLLVFALFYIVSIAYDVLMLYKIEKQPY